jgi:DNA helicase-2/ATP-dependent DNA helicase PcrA
MILWPRFLDLVIQTLSRRIDEDPGQLQAISAPREMSLFLVAGPGTGKTTALVLRLLKLILVDDLEPGAILATTFTRKAAAELRSRVLGWGDRLRQGILADATVDEMTRRRLRRLDFNRLVTGTVDSIAQDLLTRFRPRGTQPPIPLDEFVANAIMQRSALWIGRRDRDSDFRAYVQKVGRLRGQPNQTDMLAVCREIRDRILHDGVDAGAYLATNGDRGARVLMELLSDYTNELNRGLVTDFAGLEETLLQRLRSGELEPFVAGLSVVCVDEYQDTNWLQEQIYFELARRICGRGGSTVVVGDDDQALFRFRGATVELFSTYTARLGEACGVAAEPIYLSRNYRSTSTIVALCSEFIELDRRYVGERVAGKPRLVAARSGQFIEYPILGMFRPDAATLGRDLAVMLRDVFQGGGVRVRRGGQEWVVRRDDRNGAVGDAVLLCSSPQEYRSDGQTARLPLLLRQELGRLNPPVSVFNPRGQELSRVDDVQRICGLMLECIDSGGRIQGTLNTLPQAMAAVFNRWRLMARQFIDSDPPAPGRRRRGTLARFVTGWQARRTEQGGDWPSEVPLTQVLYSLVAWMPTFQEDSEGLVYLEAVARTITESSRLIPYDGTIQRDPPRAESSVRAILWGIFVPIASGAVDVDEDLIELLPRDRFNILSIHQAKGLEFPLTIVDASSDFKTDHWTQAFKRFPRDGSRAHALEDELRPFSRLTAPTRSAVDRAFDDLIRQYFVAYSRTQDVLMLIGLGDRQSGPNGVPNVATFWRRQGPSRWPQLAGNFVLI